MTPQLELIIKYKVDQPCPICIVFPTQQDAANHLGMFLEKFGADNYTAKFLAGDKLKLTLVPSIGGKGVWFDNLIYSAEDFKTFSNSYLNRELFLVMFGFMDGEKFVTLKLGDHAWLNVRGYEIEK